MSISNPPPTEVILLVHGIRTFATWQPMVKRVLEEIPGLEVRQIKYGYLDLFRFWFPFFTRDKPIADLWREIQNVQRDNPDACISIIAHSFGTYAISKILRDNPSLIIERLVLSGSIIPRSYRWDYVASRLAKEVTNDYGTRDLWPVLAQCLSWGYGDTGRHGFGRGATVRDRGHDYKHSQFFNEKFVRTYWKPWFEIEEFVHSKWDEKSPPPSWALSILSVLPIKWLILFLCFSLSIWFSVPPSYFPSGGKQNEAIISEPKLAGTVMDASTKKRLSGVTLSIQDFDNIHGKTPTCISDENGRFRFLGLPSIELQDGQARYVRLVASKFGYKDSLTDPWLGLEKHEVTLKKEDD